MQCFGWVSMQIFLLMCAMGSILFLGGWLSPIDIYPFTLSSWCNLVDIKDIIIIYIICLVKAIVPRYRYDQLMRLGWKVFLTIIFNLGCFNCKLSFLF